MTPEILRDKLLASAQALGWPATIEPDFVSPRFRGRQDPSAAPLPGTTIGLRLGAYPVLVAPIALTTSDQMQTSLRALHNQMVIARSYMRAEEVINAHIMLCVTATNAQADWRGYHRPCRAGRDSLSEGDLDAGRGCRRRVLRAFPGANIPRPAMAVAGSGPQRSARPQSGPRRANSPKARIVRACRDALGCPG